METQTNPTQNTTASAASFRTFKNVNIALNGFVSFPAQLITATSEEKSPFRLCVVNEDGTASPVSQFYTADHKNYFTIGQLGRAIDDGEKMIPLSAAEIASTKLTDEAKKTQIEIGSFVPLAQVDPTFFCNSYFLLPNTDPKKKGNPQAANLYAMLLAAMVKTARVGTAKMYDRDRENNIIIRPNMDGTKLMLHTIYTSAEVRNVAVPPSSIAINTDLLNAGIAMITAKFADFDANGVVSETDGLIASLAERKRNEAAGIVTPTPAAPKVATPEETAAALLASLTGALSAMGIAAAPTEAPVAKVKKSKKVTA